MRKKNAHTTAETNNLRTNRNVLCFTGNGLANIKTGKPTAKNQALTIKTSLMISIVFQNPGG
ncbi:MAG: hypothetical protein J5685_04215 [Clostridiales bacterium]|nr:hypothetical protein [Clostridiales bacterium]